MVISLSNGESHVDKPAPVDSAILPSFKSDDIELLVASHAEHMQTSRLNADEWRGPLTLEQYLKREKHLLAQDLTKDGKEVAWILTSNRLPADGTGNRSILASCETIPIQAYTALNGKLQEVLAHGVGSVYTRAEHRGRSYAKRMMVELASKLETFQQPNGERSVLTVLYSDIGQKFYSQFGWKAYPSNHIHLAQIQEDTYKQLSQGLPPVQDLTTADLPNIPTTTYVKEQLISASEARPGVSFVAVAPDEQHFRWHHAREEFVSKALGRTIPQIKGAIHQDTGVALIWTRRYKTERASWMLNVLHVVMPCGVQGSAEAQAALAALLLRAQYESHRSDMNAGVEVWDPSEDVVAAAQSLRDDKGDKLEVIERDQDHICSLRWTGPEPASHDVEWLFKQEYAWC